MTRTTMVMGVWGIQSGLVSGQLGVVIAELLANTSGKNGLKTLGLQPSAGFDYCPEIVGIEACPADQRPVDVVEGQYLCRIVGFD